MTPRELRARIGEALEDALNAYAAKHPETLIQVDEGVEVKGSVVSVKVTMPLWLAVSLGMAAPPSDGMSEAASDPACPSVPTPTSTEESTPPQT